MIDNKSINRELSNYSEDIDNLKDRLEELQDKKIKEFRQREKLKKFAKDHNVDFEKVFGNDYDNFV